MQQKQIKKNLQDRIEALCDASENIQMLNETEETRQICKLAPSPGGDEGGAL